VRLVGVRTVRQAGAWLDRVGLALLFARADVVLPSLWEAISGDAQAPWAIRDADGAFVRWSESAGIAWGLKDELPGRRIACVGRHLGGNAVALVAPRTLPLLYALTERDGGAADFRGALEGVELEVAEAVLAAGPLSGPQLRTVTGAAKKDVERAIVRLQRALVLTHAGLVEQDQGWGSVALDLAARRWELPALPAPGEARRALAELVLDRAGELTAADLAAALGWRRRLCAEVLDEVAESRDGDGFRIWTRN
jgi:winged helix DNA-binding protein